MMNRLFIGILAAIVISAVFASGLRAQQTRGSASGGIYAGDQAKRGDSIYYHHCHACHGPNLGGLNAFGPPLVGAEFLSHWTGKPIAALFDHIRLSQPADNRGSLSPQMTADILAFILHKNQYAEGENELPRDLPALQLIQLDTPP